MTNYLTAVGVQNFSIAITAGNASAALTINTVGTGAFIHFGGSTNDGSGDPDRQFVKLVQTTTSQLTLSKNGTTGAATGTGCIVDGDTTNLINSVQSATIAKVSGNLTATTTFSSVTDGNTAVHSLGQTSADTSANTNRIISRYSLSGTTGTLTVASTGDAISGVMQIVEYKTAALTANVVQRISAASSSSVTSWTGAIANSVTTGTAYCVYGGYTTASAVLTDRVQWFRGSLTDGVTFTVNVNTGEAVAKTYNTSVVDTATGVLNSNVQRGTTTLTAAASGTTAISPAVTYANAGGIYLGYTSTGTGFEANTAFASVELTSGSLMTTLLNAAGTVTSSWEMTEYTYSATTAIAINATCNFSISATAKSDATALIEEKSLTRQDSNSLLEEISKVQKDINNLLEYNSNAALNSNCLIEEKSLVKTDATTLEEVLSNFKSDARQLIEENSTSKSDAGLIFESTAKTQVDPRLNIDIPGSLAVQSDGTLIFEAISNIRSDTRILEENISSQKSDGGILTEEISAVQRDGAIIETISGQRADGGLLVEEISSVKNDGILADESVGAVATNANCLIEFSQASRAEITALIEVIAKAQADAPAQFENTGQFAVTINGNSLTEWLSSQVKDTPVYGEFVGAMKSEAGILAEIIGGIKSEAKGQLEFIARSSRDLTAQLESITAFLNNSTLPIDTLVTAATFTANSILQFEWKATTAANAPVQLESLQSFSPSRIIDPAFTGQIIDPENIQIVIDPTANSGNIDPQNQGRTFTLTITKRNL